jgi:hypothetical protein
VKVHARYIQAPNWEKIVADATADAPGARSACAAKAADVEASAIATLEAYNISKRTTRLASLVRDWMGTKPVKDFERERLAQGSTIPVALVISDSKFSQIVEVGGGPNTPASHYMLNAGWSRAGGDWEFNARGLGRDL